MVRWQPPARLTSEAGGGGMFAHNLSHSTGCNPFPPSSLPFPGGFHVEVCLPSPPTDVEVSFFS